MAATPYKPVSVNDSILTTTKLQQMANNDQWLFENSPRIRYSAAGIVKDQGLKIISGKTSFGTSGADYVEFTVYFGSFFSAACKPVVVATVEVGGNDKRKLASIEGLGGEIDYRGFHGFVTTQENQQNNAYWSIDHSGWVHWIAMGF